MYINERGCRQPPPPQGLHARSVELKITFEIDDGDDKTTTLFLCKILLLHIWEIKWKFHVPIRPPMVLAVAICWIARNFHHYSLQFRLAFLQLLHPSNYPADPFRFYYFLFNSKDVYYSLPSVRSSIDISSGIQWLSFDCFSHPQIEFYPSDVSFMSFDLRKSIRFEIVESLRFEWKTTSCS